MKLLIACKILLSCSVSWGRTLSKISLYTNREELLGHLQSTSKTDCNSTLIQHCFAHLLTCLDSSPLEVLLDHLKVREYVVTSSGLNGLDPHRGQLPDSKQNLNDATYGSFINL